jgi:hypothetical protein
MDKWKSQRVPFTTSNIFYHTTFMIFPPILFKQMPEFIEDALLPTLTKYCYVFKSVSWQADTYRWLTGPKKVVNLRQHQNVIQGHDWRKWTTAPDRELFWVVIFNLQFKVKYASCFGLNKPSQLYNYSIQQRVKRESRCDISNLYNVMMQLSMYPKSVEGINYTWSFWQ